jgi:hypothetical protein
MLGIDRRAGPVVQRALMTSPRSWPVPVLLVAMLVLGAAGCARSVTVPSWDPAAFRALDTLEFRTTGPEEGQHWSTVWLVVLDDQVYVRLGPRATDRMQRNTTAPYVAVRIGGREYERVRAEDAAALAPKVADAMASKYTSDLLVRHVSHPLTMRLVPETTPGGPP